MYQKRLDRARELQRSQRGLDKETPLPEKFDDEGMPFIPEPPDPAQEIERGDMAALMLSGLLTAFIPASALLIALVLFTCLLFGII